MPYYKIIIPSHFSHYTSSTLIVNPTFESWKQYCLLPFTSPILTPHRWQLHSQRLVMHSPDTRPRTWTRVAPDHYNAGIKSLSPQIDVNTPPFPFMSLPVELRLEVYKIYLADRYTLTPTEIHEMVLDSRHRTKSSAEILRVSKTVNAEVRDLLQHEKTITLRICWQDATLDGFAMSCLQARGMHLDYDRIAHLRVEIYSRHRERPTDMVRIWRCVQNLCSNLQKASCVQKLSVHFMENEYAVWFHCGSPLETFEFFDHMQLNYGLWTTWDEPWDILHVLNLFMLLRNVQKAQIHLPLSVTENERLQEARETTEGVMMQTIPLDERYQKTVIGSVGKAIAEREYICKYLSGRCAQQRLERLCGEGGFIHTEYLDIFDKVWPHRKFSNIS